MRIRIDHVRRHPVLATAVIVALVLTLFFATRLIVGAVSWQGHQEEPIRAWMTVGYIGHSWDLDPRMIDQRAGLPLPEGRPLTLSEIAQTRGIPVAEVIATVEAVVQEMKAEQRD